jgi:hypothetical protein
MVRGLNEGLADSPTRYNLVPSLVARPAGDHSAHGQLLVAHALPPKSDNLRWLLL